MAASSSPRRVAIVDGLRTPFAKSGTVFRDLTTLELSSAVVSELLARSGLDGAQIDRVIYGSVVQDVAAPNLAREIVLAGPFPESVDAYSVSRACATSTQTVVDAAQSIMLGDADVIIAGGADSLSRPPITYSDAFVDALMRANSAKDLPSKARAFSSVRPKHLVPVPPGHRRTINRRNDGRLGREDGKGQRDQPRGPGCVRDFIPHQGKRSLGRRHLRRRK